MSGRRKAKGKRQKTEERRQKAESLKLKVEGRNNTTGECIQALEGRHT